MATCGAKAPRKSAGSRDLCESSLLAVRGVSTATDHVTRVRARARASPSSRFCPRLFAERTERSSTLRRHGRRSQSRACLSLSVRTHSVRACVRAQRVADRAVEQTRRGKRLSYGDPISRPKAEPVTTSSSMGLESCCLRSPEPVSGAVREQKRSVFSHAMCASSTTHFKIPNGQIPCRSEVESIWRQFKHSS